MTESPEIEAIKWGRMEVRDLGVAKDFKLYPGGGRAWDWNETGTRHLPGIQPEDVEELLEHGSNVIVLSRGMLLALRTKPKTLALLESEEIPFFVEETRAAVKRYNLLARDTAVGGLFHSTC